MKRIMNYTIATEYEGHKISEFLRNQGYSKQLLTTLRHTEGSIFLDDVEVHMNARLLFSQKLQVVIYESETASDILPVDLPIQILYEDEDLFVINKPCGMPIHPSRSNPDNSLANALAFLYQSRNDLFVYRCVNRLDKDTTGLTIIAKNALSSAILYELVKSRLVKRTYYALVADSSIESSTEALPASGTIDLPISREEETSIPFSIKRYIDMENGATAITHYKVLQRFDSFSLVELHLDTGRTHQIRVHMQAIGHPLLGDPLYNPTEKSLSRHALHAGLLEFPHPITGEQLRFEAPLPNDMKRLL